MTDIDRGYLGHRLLERGFSAWARYMFRVINRTEFICETLHHEMFRQIQDVIDGKTTRLNLNMCPRTGKTTNAELLCAYAFAINPRAQIIYTSFNQDLLNKISKELAAIMRHPAYLAMYPNVSRPVVEDLAADPIDDFWRDYLVQTTGKSQYSSRKIITAAGGCVLFNSIGAAITGFGAGVRNAPGFSGILIIDDPDKPTDVRSEAMRKKTRAYFTDTLLTRLNNSDTPILNIQQRLHPEDLSGFLASEYAFQTFKFPLLDIDGTCNLPRQYTPARVQELQRNTATFAAQYQQAPVLDGGNLIKTEWFRRYNAPPARFDNLFIVADTAFSEKKSADNSAFLLCGTLGKDLYLLDGYCKKVIFPDLCRGLVSFHGAAVANWPASPFSAVYIENKGSGISLIQQMRAQGLPIAELMPTVYVPELRKDQISDKFTRFNEIAADLESGYCHIPETAPWLLEFLAECEAFTGGKQDAHDDYVDCLMYALKQRRKGLVTDWSAMSASFMRF